MELPNWTLLPFPALVLAIASLPIALPHFWEKRAFQVVVLLAASLPVLGAIVAAGGAHEVTETAFDYASFITTLAALQLSRDL